MADFTKKAAIAIALVAMATLVVMFLWAHAYLLFVFLASILYAIVVHRFASWVSRKTRLPYKVACAGVVLAGVGLTVGAAVLLAHPLVDQARKLIAEAPKILEHARRLPFFARVANGGGDAAKSAASHVPSMMGAFSEGVAAIVVWFFVGVYGAFEPKLYRHGFLMLVPPHHRMRASELLDELDESLWHWMLGRAVAMAVVGVGTSLGLLALKVPMAIALGVLAGSFAFVDYAGAILAAIPPLLVALPLGAPKALAVLALYTATHVIEGYFLTPYIVKRAVHLPPAFTLASQAILGAVFGVLGLTFATPLTIVGLVLVKRLYVKEA